MKLSLCMYAGIYLYMCLMLNMVVVSAIANDLSFQLSW
jgi:hypothetical protein